MKSSPVCSASRKASAVSANAVAPAATAPIGTEDTYFHMIALTWLIGSSGAAIAMAASASAFHPSMPRHISITLFKPVAMARVSRRSGCPWSPAEARVRYLQVGQVVGNVDLVFQERFQRYDLEGALVGARQHHGGGVAVVVGAKPVQRGDAPSVSG